MKNEKLNRLILIYMLPVALVAGLAFFIYIAPEGTRLVVFGDTVLLVVASLFNYWLYDKMHS